MANGMKNDKLDALIMLSAHVLAENNAAEVCNADTTNVVVPKYLDYKIKRAINRERKKQKKQNYGKWFYVLKNIAAVFFITCTVAMMLVMSVEAARTAFWNTIVDWFDDHIAIYFVTEDTIPTSIEETLQPTAYPDEWEFMTGGDMNAVYSVRYIFDGKIVVIFHQGLINNDSIWSDNNNTIITDVKIGDYDGTLVTFTDDSSKLLSWCNGEYSFSLSTQYDDITIELLIEMAESVK